ncbi:carbohydrate ABC transporter permease [Brachybacterium huguangmaarense]
MTSTDTAPETADAPLAPAGAQLPSDPPRTRGKAGHWLLFGALVVPNLVLLSVFTYRPLLDNIRLSFFDWNISSPIATFIGLDNYTQWAASPDTWRIVMNTVIFTVCVVVGAMGLGLLLALLLDQKLAGRNIVRSAIFAPFVLSGAAVGIAFQFVFDPNFGMIRDLLARVGVAVPDFYQVPGWALFMVTVTYIWKSVGYSFVIYLAALQGTRQDLYEAAAIDHASRWTTFTRITLPQLRPTTFFLSITVMLNSLQVFDVINVMTRGGPQNIGTTTMIYQVYLETFVNGRAGYGATVATVMFAVLLLITVVQVRAMDKDGAR